MPTITGPGKLENAMRVNDRAYVGAMAMRTRAATQQVKRSDKDDADRNWETRQLILQSLRERGFRMVLHVGDIGYHDDELDDLVRALDEGEPDGLEPVAAD